MDDDCEGCEECTEVDAPVPSRRWRWLDLGIYVMDFCAESALSFARMLTAVNESMRAHYNWQVDQRQYENLAELDSISLTEE